MPTEKLVTCERCGTANILPRGLKAHLKSAHCQREALQRSIQREAQPKLSRSEPHNAVAQKDCAGPRPGGAAAGAGAAAVGAGNSLARPARVVTLGDLDVLPATPQAARSLAELSLPELEKIDTGLRWLPEKLEGMSGVCAVLSGLVLAEIKGRCEHKTWTPWLLKNYGKSARTARLKMQIADVFSKTATGCHFAPQQLTLAMLDDTQTGALDVNHPVVMAVSKWADGRSYRTLIAEETGDGRAENPGGFRPNALILRAWLEETYADDPQLPAMLAAETFTELPPSVQQHFKKEGKRYEERLTKEQRQELEDADAARQWNAAAAPSITEAHDAHHYHRATPEQNAQLIEALRDFAADVVKFEAARKAGKIPRLTK